MSAAAPDNRRLHVVRGDLPAPLGETGACARDEDAERGGTEGTDGTHTPGTTPLVGYLVLVPEGTDPAELLGQAGTVAEIRRLVPAGEAPGLPAAPPAPAAPAPAPEPVAGRPDPASPAPESGQGGGAGAASVKGIHIDVERHLAEVDGRELGLTYLEFELLAHLVAHPHRVHSRDHLVSALWGYSHIGDGRTVDVHVARLRRKLGPVYRNRIVTVRRIGYKYVPGAAR